MQIIKRNNDKVFYCIILCVAFLLYLFWAYIIPFNNAPDEYMRYDICKYIYKYGSLPHGAAEEIRDSNWGFSYGFTPYITQIIGAFFMRVFSLFSGEEMLVFAARLPSVIFSTGTVGLLIKIARKIWKEPYAKMLVMGVAFLPQFVFISSYVNNDSFGIFTVAFIIYAMLMARDSNWSFKPCILLGAAIGLCSVSYYNSYGMILVAIAYAVISVVMDKKIEHKVKFIALRVGWVAAAFIVVAGWWFIRNAVLYEGDFLGIETSRKYGEMYAIDAYKPSKRQTPSSTGLSLWWMLDDLKWIETSEKSYIGTFGYMNLWLPEWMYTLMLSIFRMGIWANVIQSKEKLYKRDDKRLFYCCMSAMCLITIGLSIYYSWFNDFQPQGRYCLPMSIPFAILFLNGWQGVLSNASKRIRNVLITAFFSIMIYYVLYSTINILLFKYYY